MTPKEFAFVMIGFLKEHTTADLHPAIDDVAEYIETVQTYVDKLEKELVELKGKK